MCGNLDGFPARPALFDGRPLLPVLFGSVIEPVLNRLGIRGVAIVDSESLVIVLVLDNLRLRDFEPPRSSFEESRDDFRVCSQSTFVERIPERGIVTLPLLEQGILNPKDLSNLLIRKATHRDHLHFR